jgi:hypothetical protein
VAFGNVGNETYCPTVQNSYFCTFFGSELVLFGRETIILPHYQIQIVWCQGVAWLMIDEFWKEFGRKYSWSIEGTGMTFAWKYLERHYRQPQLGRLMSQIRFQVIMSQIQVQSNIAKSACSIHTCILFYRIEDDDEIERDLNRVSMPQQNRNCVVQ